MHSYGALRTLLYGSGLRLVAGDALAAPLRGQPGAVTLTVVVRGNLNIDYRVKIRKNVSRKSATLVH